jgi:hypothetical protein
MQKDTGESKNTAKKNTKHVPLATNAKQQSLPKDFEVEEASTDKPPKKVSEAGTVTGWQVPQTRKKLAYGIFTGLFVLMMFAIITGNYIIIALVTATGFKYAAQRIIDYYFPEPINRQRLSELFMRYLILKAELKAGRKNSSILADHAELPTPLIEEKPKGRD